MAPAVSRAAGFTTIVTLHNMLGLTDLAHVGAKVTRLDRCGAHVATWLLRAADAVCVLRPEYASLLRDRYGLSHVHYLAHGTLGTPLSQVSVRRDPVLLAFGHFGGYKRLHDLIAVVRELAGEGLDVTLRIGGSDSRHAPGYLDRMRAAHAGRHVEFLGYVPEHEVPALFQRAAVSVLPYATITGMSGVAVQSAMYGVPMVASDIPPFRALQREGLRMNFFEWNNRTSLKAVVLQVLAAPSRAARQAEDNLAYSRANRMETTVDGYLDLAESLLARRGRTPRLAFTGS
jgi:glycosyltransferase involved in cell wall biosynthesis